MRRSASCPVCRDEAEEGTVMGVDDDSRAVLVRLEEGIVEVAADLVAPLRPGDRVLVHVGFVIATSGLKDGGDP